MAPRANEVFTPGSLPITWRERVLQEELLTLRALTAQLKPAPARPRWQLARVGR